MISERARTAYSESADHLARRALDALQGAGGAAVAAAHVEAAASEPEGDPAVALGAVRVLGADVLAPYVLTGLPPSEGETAAVGLALGALPPADPPPPAPPEGPEQAWTVSWIGWGLATALSRLGSAASPASPAPLPPAPPWCDDSAPRRLPVSPADGGSGGPAREGWVPWSIRMGQLASLALPGLDGPVHAAARSGVLGLARGATRATLRRDFPTAARITRWLAWLHADGARLPLDPALLTEYTGLVGGGGRTALDTAIARRLLGLEPV
ncbi:hypothetical protein CP973_17590 [Streptomyces albofaciens JCM 4342]|uniref:hypothetical protein n=1 Tax=Streptomyces albofaciens TaxID=66866 RepID=UPI001238E1D1|nr:hypothetical protein [Streptomyces albofaciens]KAA6223496.1 hypothetical protein CP973_17590 [Streptomyces albofaciens JCM 4342]